MTWTDFLKVENSVDALLHACGIFTFAKHQRNFLSPFWKAFRRFTKEGTTGAATNLDHTSFKGGAIDDGPAEVRAFFAEQEGTLLQDEIKVLDPQVCIFFTGPNRDHLIDRRWPEVLRTPLLPGIPVRQLCRLVHAGLPEHSYRTYHPAHLSRCDKGFYLDAIEEQLGDA